MPINIVKGMHDIYGEEVRGHEVIEEILKAVSNLYGYTEYRTPILEHTELFLRSVGESSDVVRKEMYTFLDKGERSVTLRPELTAGIMRLIVGNKLYATQDLPIKAAYFGPSFRYERPGLGRYRQFHQFGIECVGVESYLHDVETIVLGYDCLKRLGFDNVILKINTLGDAQSRENYKQALKEFFSNKISTMCPDCQERLKINPLRILDCKVLQDQEVIKSAPKMSDYLSNEAKEYFQKIVSLLEDMQIPFAIDDSLVRGLDYYSHIVFEFHYITKLGVNYGAIGAGGHYDELVEEVGGPKLRGVGFAMGLERIYAALKDDGLLVDIQDSLDIYVMPLDEMAIDWGYSLTMYLRSIGYRTEVSVEKRNIKQLFKRAEHLNTTLAILIGESELKEEKVVLRDFKNKTQITVNMEELIPQIEAFFQERQQHATACECGCGNHESDENHSHGECKCHKDIEE